MFQKSISLQHQMAYVICTRCTLFKMLTCFITCVLYILLPLALLSTCPDKWVTEPTQPSCHNRKRDLQQSNNRGKETTEMPLKPDLHLEIQTHCLSDTDTLRQLYISKSSIRSLALKTWNHLTWNALLHILTLVRVHTNVCNGWIISAYE